VFAAPAPAVWRLDNLDLVGGLKPLVWGAPSAGPDSGLRFGGVRDGLLVPGNPIAGWPQFTVAVLFLPEAGGPAAQRFLHIEDGHRDRLTVETRIVGGDSWCLDTFLLSGKSQRTLLDMKRLHPAGRWAWAELTYDGRTMRSYVDGRPELSGPVSFAPMGEGRTSVGVRMNRVFWFQGRIKEVRFYPAALDPADLPGVP
jgi:hypothetical protein